MRDQIFIAEVKTESPFGWKADKSWNELFDIAEENGDWLSIHTSEPWGGSFADLALARALTDKPIVAKGIHENDYDIRRAIDTGADYVLVVGRTPGVHLDGCIIEVNKIQHFKIIPKITKEHKHVKTAWNQRNLDTGESKLTTFDEARLAWDGFLVQASCLEKPADVHPDADAYIVGEHLPQFVNARE